MNDSTESGAGPGLWANRVFQKLYWAHVVSLLGSGISSVALGEVERPHIFAAHFALSHAGWGLTYPLAGVLTTQIGFANAGWIFSALLLAVALPFWLSLSRSLQGSDPETNTRRE